MGAHSFQPEPAKESAVPSVLLVDDNPKNLMALEVALRDTGARLLQAHSGLEALKVAQENDLAAILLDVQMPELSGPDTARLLRQDAHSCRVPIIFVTANHSDRRDIATAYEAGCVDYLEKPVEPEILRAKIATFIELYEQRVELVSRQAQLWSQHAARADAEAKLRDAHEAHRNAELEGQALDTLHRVSTALLAELNLDRIASTLLTQVTALTSAKCGAFFCVLDGAQDGVYTQYVEAQPPALTSAPPTARWDVDTLRRLCQRASSGVFVGCLGTDDAGSNSDSREGTADPQNFLAVPLLDSEGRDIGGLVLSDKEAGHFTAHDQRMTKAIALQASVAIANGRIYARAEQARRRAEAAEAALRTSEARLRLAMEATLIGTWDMSPATGTFVCDERTKMLFGVPVDVEVDYKMFLANVNAADRERVGKAVKRSLDPAIKEPYDVEFRTVEIGGEAERWLQARGQVVFVDETAERFIGTVLDVSTRKRAEHERAELIAAEREARAQAEAARQRAEAANRAKDEFLATASHELRTPLSAILGWSSILISKAVSPEQLTRALTTIERNAKVQVQLVEDILDVSRIITGKLRIVARELDVETLVDAAVETARAAAEGKQVALLTEYVEVVGKVVADPDRLQQIVWNLVANGVKFTPRGGQVRVRVARENSGLTIEVADNGQGLTPDALPFVFNRFWQDDGSTTRKHGGLGLGLSIVRHLVELHGGSISVRSPGLGRGSTFTVQLPIRAVSVGEDRSAGRTDRRRTASAPPPPGLHGIRVIVVDDEPDARELVAFVLEEAGASVTSAASAQEAFELLLGQQVDALVSDIGMPREDGYSLIRRVRAVNGPAGSVPAIALTAFAREEDVRSAIAAGFQMHTSKPVEPSALVTMVSELVGGQRHDAK